MDFLENHYHTFTTRESSSTNVRNVKANIKALSPSTQFRPCDWPLVGSLDGSSAWIAIEPGPSNPQLGNLEAILQSGVIACNQYGPFTACRAQEKHFWWAEGGCGASIPDPQNLGLADNSTHTYEISHASNNWYSLKIDAVTKVTFLATEHDDVSCWIGANYTKGAWAFEKWDRGDGFGDDTHQAEITQAWLKWGDPGGSGSWSSPGFTTCNRSPTTGHGIAHCILGTQSIKAWTEYWALASDRQTEDRDVAESKRRIRATNRRNARVYAAVGSRQRGSHRWPVGTLVAAAIGLAFASSWLGRGAFPRTAGGLEVQTVSEILTQRDQGVLSPETVAVGGYWTDRTTGHSCAPATDVGELEIRCHDGEFGITELDEPIMSIGDDGRLLPATSAHVTPWFESDVKGLGELFALPVINGQRFPPVPIVVMGHFDDPRAKECQPSAVELCRDRLVVSEIQMFSWESVRAPVPSPTGTPFPYSKAGLFDPTRPDLCGGNVAYSFVGWTTTEELGVPFDREGHVWAAITAEPVLLGGTEWVIDDAQEVKPYRVWGRRICLAEERNPTAILYAAVPHTTYKEFADGTTVAVEVP